MIVIILAGGKGKRMKSDQPKVLVDIFGKPLLVRLIRRSLFLEPSKILVVTSPDPLIQNTVNQYFPKNDKIHFVVQQEALGTGHAVQKCLEYLPSNDEKVIILCGDIPFLTRGLMKRFVDETNICALLTVELDIPTGFGRIVEENGKIRIVEEKDCDEEQKKIKLVNTGIYCMQSNLIQHFTPRIQNKNAQGEYYLTDIMGMISQNNYPIQSIELKEEKIQVLGVNTKEELESLLKAY